ncbi:MAG TPA: protein-L-isoaspartate(D-aspartate) O-methyltransferase [Opitutaceae bacterium]|nr:protein-L-isoaspartate(D-aspartate) O-methyltransferase [Opitutaceae bacterium]
METQLIARDIADARVLAAMAAVPRHEFVPGGLQSEAYDDNPLAIGHGQTISQPYIVALMLQLLSVPAGGIVLEIGTGCGYQAAVLGYLAGEVCSIEIVPELARRAGATLARLGARNIEVRAGDGRRGWPERAPFAGIVVAAAARAVQPAWGEQLALGGRLVVPLGGRGEQWLHVFTKEPGGLRDETTIPVRFVPLTGGGPRGVGEG